MSFSYHNSNTNVPARRFTAIDGVGYGKVAIITGCSSGVGLATTQLFLSHQYEVLGVDINDIEYSEISENDHGRFHFHKADLTVPGECDEVVRISVGKFGEKIDVLANVAGIMDNFEAADVISDAVWDRVIGVNLTVPTKMMQAVLPFMKAKKYGSIINVCSKASTSGAASGIAYTASKHGLLGVTKHTAWRFKNEGIRCNAVTPGGAIDTNISSSMDQTKFDQASHPTLTPVWALHNPPDQKPTIQSSEIADVILFLASDQAKSINGAAVPVDNAWSVI